MVEAECPTFIRRDGFVLLCCHIKVAQASTCLKSKASLCTAVYTVCIPCGLLCTGMVAVVEGAPNLKCMRASVLHCCHVQYSVCMPRCQQLLMYKPLFKLHDAVDNAVH